MYVYNSTKGYIPNSGITGVNHCEHSRGKERKSVMQGFNCVCNIYLGFPYSSDGKESACNAGAQGSVPRSGGPPGEGNGNPLQYSCLENAMDRGAWWATVHGVAKSRTRLSE